MDGDATGLLHALGETEPMTDANHHYRVSLVTAYAVAYLQAAGRGQSPADSPSRIASLDFPGENPAAQAGTPGAPTTGRHLPTAPQARPRQGPRA